MKKLIYTIEIKASKPDVWKVVSDVRNYHDIAPNIDTVKILSGNKQGMVRQCSHGKDSWKETCTLWLEEEAYSFQVDTKDPDYPYPIKYLQGHWKLEELSSQRTRLSMEFTLKYKYWIMNLMHGLMKYRFDKISNQLLNNWRDIIEESDKKNK